MNDPRDPRNQLHAIAELATAAATGWPTYQTTSAALANSTIPNAGGGTQGGDISDPTYAAILSHERYGETTALIAEAIGIMRDVQRRMASIRRQHPETARDIDAAIRAARCDGSVDPTCTDNAVRKGLCWSCYQKQRRAEDRSA